ncbi:hypothetical protein SDC9_80231 [bioreactor metagenome]|uniref:Uncharacterized protein n=1 Tax=bioreactor metagenome TaxID=1076179 RepID=A0A644Z6D6_9ZZZZ
MQHGGVATQQQRLARLRRCIDHGGIAGRKQLCQLFAQFLAQLVVQVHQRLVKQHQRRILGQRTGQRHALLLATRQLGGQAIKKHVDMQPLGQLFHPRIDVLVPLQFER